jgi:hypothetical protein
VREETRIAASFFRGLFDPKAKLLKEQVRLQQEIELLNLEMEVKKKRLERDNLRETVRDAAPERPKRASKA